MNHNVLTKLKKIATYSGTMSSTTEAVTDTDIEAGDLVFAQLQASSTAASVQKATAGAGTVTFLFSAAPGASSTILYFVVKGN